MPLVEQFSYADFASTTGANLVGDAAVVSSKLRLTPASAGKVGALWRTVRASVGPGFSTEFTFQILGGGGVSNGTHEPHGPGGDGFTFCIQDVSNTEIHSGGADLGYGGIINAVVFEFDTYDDFTFADIGDNELAIHASTSGVSHRYDLSGIAHVNISGTPNMKDGSVHTGKIVYDRYAEEFRVYIDNILELSYSGNLNTLVDLPDDGNLFVGFTGSTGSAYESHDILSWSFSSFLAEAKHAVYHNGQWEIMPSVSI